MVYGYIRISDFTPSELEQLSLLTTIELDDIYTDINNPTLKKIGFQKLLNHLKEEDEIYVYSMICLSSDLDEFEKNLSLLKEKNICLHFLKENLHSNKDNLLSIFQSFREYFKKSDAETKSIILKIMQEQGEEIGRPKKEYNTELFELLYQKKKSGSLYKGKKVTIKLMVELLGISKQTVYDRLKEREALDQREG